MASSLRPFPASIPTAPFYEFSWFVASRHENIGASPLDAVQATLTGGTLRLERALDEKERELQLQRAEIHGLRERLRALEIGERRAGCIADASGVSNAATRRASGVRSPSPPSPFLGPTWYNAAGGAATYPEFDGSRPVSPEGMFVDVAPPRPKSGSNHRGRHFGDVGAGSAPPGAHSAVLRPQQLHTAAAGQPAPNLTVSSSGNR